MNILTVDIGTSNAKLGFFRDEKLVYKEKGVKSMELQHFADKYNPDRIIVSSVTIGEDEVKEYFSRSNNVTVINGSTALPFENKYLSKDTLGTDRIAAVAGAFGLYKDENCLIIDTGTCITYDLLTAEGTYLGGAISPGIELKFKALNNYTSRLPLLERQEEADLVGNDTKSAILSGVINGTLAEIREIIRMYQNKLPDLQLVICGGDSQYYKNRLKINMNLQPDLVLMGLKTIQEYNG